MKTLYILLLVTIVRGFPNHQDRYNRSANIPAPNDLGLTAVNPPGFEVKWKPVESSEPIVGYKVNIWESPDGRTYKSGPGNGKHIIIEMNSTPQLLRTGPPQGKPRVISTSADQTKVRFNDVKLGEWYEIRVQATSSAGDGPLSNPMRINIG